MKLYVVLAGLLGYFEPEASQKVGLEALLLAGDPAAHVAAAEARQHRARMVFTPDKYAKDSNNNLRRVTWMIDGDNVSVNDMETSYSSEFVNDTDNHWQPLLMESLVEKPGLRAECKGDKALAACTKGGRNLLQARVVLHGDYKLYPVEVARDGSVIPGDETIVSSIRSLDTNQNHSTAPAARYAAAVVASADAAAPVVVKVNGFSQVLAQSSPAECKEVYPKASSSDNCYILTITNFSEPLDKAIKKTYDPVGRDFVNFYDLLEYPPGVRWVPVARLTPFGYQDSTDPPETRCSGVVFPPKP